MVCLGLEPVVAGWKAQTNPLSYSGTTTISINKYSIKVYRFSSFFWP